MRYSELVPPGWIEQPISDVAPFQRGFDLPARAIRHGDYPIIYSNGVGGKHHAAMVSGPGVVTGRSGTLGKIFYIERDFWPHNTSLWVTNFKSNDAKFISYLYKMIGFERFASGSGVPTLNRNDAHSFLVRVPCNPGEQKAIAQALSDIDDLIASLDALIAKKRDIKQGAMQQLLTGKRRLPGFSGEWAQSELSRLTDCLDNLRVPLNEVERSTMIGNYPYCGANGVVGEVDGFVLDDDVILLAEDGGYFDQFATRPIAYRMIGKIWVNNHAHILRAKPNVNQGFLFYSLVHKDITPFLASGTRAKLNKSEMNKILVDHPASLKEQEAIAAFLQLMDDELAAMNETRQKYWQVRQGMMQQLLTGRIRLV